MINSATAFSSIGSSENIVFFAKVGFQTGYDCLAVINYKKSMFFCLETISQNQVALGYVG